MEEKARIAIGPKTGSRLNDRQRRFLENLLLKGMSQVDAYIGAGYHCSTRESACAAASIMLKKLKEEGEYIAQIERIEDEGRASLKAQIQASIRKLIRLRDQSEQDSVQLKAALDILRLAGMEPVQKHELESKSMALVVDLREDPAHEEQTDG